MTGPRLVECPECDGAGEWTDEIWGNRADADSPLELRVQCTFCDGTGIVEREWA